MSNSLERAMREAAARAMVQDPGLRMVATDEERKAIEARRDELLAEARPERHDPPSGDPSHRR